MKSIFLHIFLVLLAHSVYSQSIEIPAVKGFPERSRDYDALHYKMVLSVDVDKKHLEGQNTISLVPLKNHFNQVELDAKTLVVKGVTDNSGINLNFRQTDQKVFIDLPRSYGVEDTVIVTVKYFLSEPVGGLRFIDAKGERPQQVSSDCFPNKAHEWIPCYDFPNDKASQDVIVTTASKYKVLSNGKLISKEANSNGTSTWHWQQGKPNSTYLINLSIGDYLVVKDSLANLPINYWVYKSMAGDVERVFGKTPYMIDFYNKLYNYDFPWDKYDQVISGYMNGGAEATSATLLGESVVTDEFTEQDYYLEYIIAHEIAHQWWGDLITLRSWEHTWLNESFATYSDYLYTAFDKGKDEGDYDLLQKKNTYLKEAHDHFMRPIVYTGYAEPGENFNHHTYQKGACNIHLLRYILGDETFFRVLSAFLHEYQFQPVTTYDFMKCVRDVSGKNMDWFFGQYFFLPGHPVFNVSKSWNEASKELTITVTQEQDKWEGVPIYTIPLRIGIYANNEKTVHEYWMKDKTDTIRITLENEPDMVRFDDGNYLLKELEFKKEFKELLFQSEKDDMIGRLWAVGQLSAYADNPVTIAAWKKIAVEDEFWAVRAGAVEQLSKYCPLDCADILKKAAKDERSKVRGTAIRALGAINDPKLKPYFKDTFKNDNSYFVKSEAIIAIGKHGNKSDLPFLKKAELQKSYNDVVGKAARKYIALINGNE